MDITVSSARTKAARRRMYVTSATEASVINTLMRVKLATIKGVISGPV